MSLPLFEAPETVKDLFKPLVDLKIKDKQELPLDKLNLFLNEKFEIIQYLDSDDDALYVHLAEIYYELCQRLKNKTNYQKDMGFNSHANSELVKAVKGVIKNFDTTLNISGSKKHSETLDKKGKGSALGSPLDSEKFLNAYKNLPVNNVAQLVLNYHKKFERYLKDTNVAAKIENIQQNELSTQQKVIQLYILYYQLENVFFKQLHKELTDNAEGAEKNPRRVQSDFKEEARRKCRKFFEESSSGKSQKVDKTIKVQFDLVDMMLQRQTQMQTYLLEGETHHETRRAQALKFFQDTGDKESVCEIQQFVKDALISIYDIKKEMKEEDRRNETFSKAVSSRLSKQVSGTEKSILQQVKTGFSNEDAAGILTDEALLQAREEARRSKLDFILTFIDRLKVIKNAVVQGISVALTA